MFQRPEHVKRHLKSHSSEKPFECQMPNCGKRFNRKDNLKAHLKKIHGLVKGQEEFTRVLNENKEVS